MIKNIFPVLCLFIFSLNCTFATPTNNDLKVVSSKQKPLSQDDCCGQYGNTKIYKSEIIDYYSQVYDPAFTSEKFLMFSKEQQEQLIKSYILRQIFIKEADGSKILHKGSKYFDYYETAKLELKKDIFIKSKLEDAIKEDDLYNEYSNFIRQLKDKGQVTLKYVVFVKESDAQAFIADINSGKKTFESAIQEASGANTKNQITILPGMWPGVESEIFNTKVNNLTRPLKLQGMFIVAKIISKKKVDQLPSFQAKRDEMRQKVTLKIMNQITKDLERKYNVQVFTK